MCVNDGGKEVWIRAEDKKDPFYRGTSGLFPIFSRCLRLTQQRPRLDDGSEVLAPAQDGTLQPALIVDSIEKAPGAKYAGTRVVRFVDDGFALWVPEGRLVKYANYFRKLLGVGYINGMPPHQDGSAFGCDGEVAIWRSAWIF